MTYFEDGMRAAERGERRDGGGYWPYTGSKSEWLRGYDAESASPDPRMIPTEITRLSEREL